MRYADSPSTLNADTFTLYDGEFFRGAELYGTGSMPSLGNMAGKGSSLIITGLSPWTFYS